MGAKLVIRNSGECGTSLIEVLVALVLIAIGALGVVPMLVSSMNVSATAGDIGSLSAKATARLESLRAEDFYDLTAGGSLTASVAGYSDASDPDGLVRWEIVNGGGPAGTKTIRVAAFALDPAAGLRKHVELTTLRSK